MEGRHYDLENCNGISWTEKTNEKSEKNHSFVDTVFFFRKKEHTHTNSDASSYIKKIARTLSKHFFWKFRETTQKKNKTFESYTHDLFFKNNNRLYAFESKGERW